MEELATLLLEDCPDDAARMTALLRQIQSPRTHVHHVGTLADAIRALAERSFDLALVDLTVPDSRGLETVERVRRAAPDLPIVVQSGIEEDEMAVHAVALGAQDYLTKRTLDAEVLARTLRYAVERAAIQRALRESEERFKLAVAGAMDGIWDWDLRTHRVFFSGRWKEMLGFSDAEIGDTPEEWFALVHPDDVQGLRDAICAHLGGGRPHFEYEQRVRDRHGTWRWMLTRGLAVRDGSTGEPIRMAGSQTDISRRKAVEARLRHDALHDSLTGLPNRALFLDRLSQAIRRTVRGGSRHFAVLFLDLDRFKVVNDSLGHLAGDELLVAVARRLEGCVRPGDTVARLGGDEFAVLLEDMDSVTDAPAVADRIRDALAVPIALGSREVYTSASIGVTESTHGYTRAQDALRDADIAMYRAKREGKARHAVFHRVDHGWAMSLLELENGLCRALDRDEFVVHYQPIVDLTTGAVRGMEALLRWNCPGRGLLGPGTFVPSAEETGLITSIGRWVLQRACADAAGLAMGASAPRLSVNVSSRQVREGNLVEQCTSALEKSGLDASRLVVEITESALVDDPDAAATMLGRLRDLGVEVHLDDFGSGYSSLHYLHSFPIDVIKIDQRFVTGAGQNPRDQAILRAIIGLAHTLGIGVIAEGVETRDQLEHLRRMECGLGQGFLFSPAVRLEEARAMLARGEGPSGAISWA